MIRRSVYLSLLLLGLALRTLPGFAAPYVLTYEGRLTETSGKPVDGPIDLAVDFFRTSEGGTSILSSSVAFSSIALQEGIFSLEISLLPAEFHTVFPDTDQAVWIQVTDVTHSLVYPRQRFSMIPYALKVPVDGKTVTFNDQGQLAVAPNTLPAAGQFLTKDSGGNLIWQASSATSLQGQAIDSATTPTAGQVLKFDGTKWTPAAAAGSSGGTVTAVSIGSGPLAVANATTTPSISMTQASGVSNGYLTAADYLAFQAKEPAITAGTSAQYFRGDKTWQTLGTSATVDTGTTANKMVQLDASARIPAVDGSLITNLNPAALSTAVSVAKGGTGTATGSITGTAALTLAAGGTNQNVTLTPSGTGYTLLYGNVGIGTASPSHLLDVMGNARVAGANFTGGTPSYLYFGDTAHYIKTTIGVGTEIGDVNGLNILAPNFVFTPNYLRFGLNESGSNPAVAFNNLGSKAEFIELERSGADVFTILENANDVTLKTFANGDLILSPNGTGNVGIGTTSPAAKLDIASSSGATGSTLYVGPPKTSFSANVQAYLNSASDSFAYLNTNTASIPRNMVFVLQDNTTNNSYGVVSLVETNHAAGTKTYVSGLDGVVHNTGTGNVGWSYGIGGTVKQTGSGTTASMAAIYAWAGVRSAGTVTNNYGLYLEDQAGVGTTNYQIYSAGAAPSYFNGTVGIGTTNPQAKLHVQGGALCVSNGAGNDDCDTAANVAGTIYAQNATVQGADYAEYFRAEDDDLAAGDIVGLNPHSGLARRYQPGDRLLGVVSTKPGVVGNSAIKHQTSVLVALLGQVPFNQNQVLLVNDLVKTPDGKSIGYRLANGDLHLKINADDEIARLKADSAALKADNAALKADHAAFQAYVCSKEPQAPFCNR